MRIIIHKTPEAPSARLWASHDILLEAFARRAFAQAEAEGVGVPRSALAGLVTAKLIAQNGNQYSIASEGLLEVSEEMAAEQGRTAVKMRIKNILSLAILGITACFIGIDLWNFSSEELASRILKFSGIALVFALSLIQTGDYDRKDKLLLQGALGLSMIADFTIGIAGQFIPGLGIFALVHVVYSVRHLRSIRSTRNEVLLAGGTAIFGACVMWLSAPRMEAAGLLIPSLVYAVPLSLSVYAGLGVLIRSFYRGTSRYQVAAGALLFFVVDVAVAHFDAMDPGNMRTVTGIGVWILYLPAQYLLCVSGQRRT